MTVFLSCDAPFSFKLPEKKPVNLSPAFCHRKAEVAHRYGQVTPQTGECTGVSRPKASKPLIGGGHMSD